MVLEPLYEREFLDCSYGFRPGRSPHAAVQALWEQLMRMGGCWVIDLDVRKFFDTMDHAHLRKILAKRMRDGVITRLIGKWLKAGVMEEGNVFYPEHGTPQGGVVSPLLSNIYLHEVLDRWFTEVVLHHLQGRGFLVRFADDALMAFTHRQDAERVMRVLPRRLAKYGLTVHAEKTQLVRFTPQAERVGPAPQNSSFRFLGFTHFWGRSRRGKQIVKRKTAPDRFTRALQAVSVWCKQHRHVPLPEQQTALRRRLLGHYAYFGITGNARALENYLHEVRRVWHKWLARRGGRRYTWARFCQMLEHYPLPAARVVHSVYAARL